MASPCPDGISEFKMGPQERVACPEFGEPKPEIAARPACLRFRKLCAALILGLASVATSATSFAQDRVALVVGNGRYENIRGLTNPEHDARAIAAALRDLGFRVQEHVDLGKNELEDAIEAFAETTVGAEAALFFYAGHAVQRGGQNYLLPIDVGQVETEEDFQRTIDFSLIDFELVLRQLQTARTSLLFLDACRNDPFEFKSKIRSSDTPGGLAPIRARIGTLIAYATEPYNVAYDGQGRRHSPFTEALLRHIDTEGLEVRTLMTRVRADVANATNNQQVPWDHSSLLTEFFFKPKADQAERQVAEVEGELGVLTRAMAEKEPQQKLGALQSFVGQFPESQYRSVAEIAIRDIITASDSSNRPPQIRQAPRAIVSADEISASLDIPKPFDPDGDRLQIQVAEIPDHGVLRSSGRQIRAGDILTVDQLASIQFYPPRPFKGAAGRLVFQAQDQRGGSAVGTIGIEVLEPNRPPALALLEPVTATAGGASVPLNLPTPTDPDGDQLLIRIALGPHAGTLKLADTALAPGMSLIPEQLGQLAYEPPELFEQADAGEIVVVVSDSRGGEASGRLKVTLRPPNRPPRVVELLDRVIGDEAFETVLDVPAPFDPDADPLKVTVDGLPIGGSIHSDGEREVEVGADLSVEQLPSLRFRPQVGFFGDAGSLTLRIDDGRGGVVRQRVAINVASPNRPPILEADKTIEVIAGETIDIRLGLPVDPDSDPLVGRIMRLPDGGSILLGEVAAQPGMPFSVSDLAKLRFKAAQDAAGTRTSFAYAVADNRGGIATGTVTVNVAAPNRPPVVEARRHVATARDAEPARLIVEAPSDPDGDSLVAEVTTLPAGGEVLLNDRRIGIAARLSVDELLALLYHAGADFVGHAGSFRYNVSDGRGGSVSGETSVELLPPNRPPIIERGRLIVVTAGAGSVPLNLQQPLDPDGDQVTITVTKIPALGRFLIKDREVAEADRLTVEDMVGLSLNAPRHAAGSAGSLEFRLEDGRGGMAAMSVVLQVVPPPNRPPLVAEAPEVVATAGGAAMPLGIPSPSDPDGDRLEVMVMVLPGAGLVRAGERLIAVGDRLSPAELGGLTYEPAFFPGPMGTFVYEVHDGRGGATGGSVAINVTRPNRTPLAFEEPTLVVTARRQARLSLRTPVDPDGDPLTIVVTDLPSAGAVMLDERRLEAGDRLTSDELEALVFRAGDDPAGAAGRLSYVAEDPDGETARGGIAIEIAPPNRNPVVAAMTTVVAVAAGDPVLVVPQLPTDPDGDPLRARVVLVPSQGAVLFQARRLRAGDTLSLDDLAFAVYRAEASFSGRAGLFRYEVLDNRGGRVMADVDVTVELPNRPPVVAELRQLEVEATGQAVALDLGWPFDPDGDSLAVVLEQAPEHGTLFLGENSLDPTAELTVDDVPHLAYAADRNAAGKADVVRLTILDGRGGSITGGADLRIVAPRNRLPIVMSRGQLEVVAGGEPTPLVVPQPSDADDDPLTVEVIELPARGRVLLTERELVVGSRFPADELTQLIYDPQAADPGPAGTLEITVTDGRGGASSTRVPILISPAANQPPITVAVEPIETFVGVDALPLGLQPPTDPDDDPVLVTITKLPRGRLILAGRALDTGSTLAAEEVAAVAFVAEPGQIEVSDRDYGVDLFQTSFEYLVEDGRGGSARTTVPLQVRLHGCDKLASAADNIESVSAGVPLVAIQAERAIDACNDALVAYPDIVRFQFQLARALQAAGLTDEAREQYQVAAQSGDLAAQHNLGVLLLEGGAAADGVWWLTAAADGGSPAAMNSLGLAYLSGAAGAIDRKKAIEWFARAAQLRYPAALTNLALGYLKGEGVERNLDNAELLLLAAADLNYASAQTNLGYLYATEEFNRLDYEQAVTWFSAAAEQGDPRAALNLATLHLLGKGAPQDPAKAVIWYRAAIRSGDQAIAEEAASRLAALPERTVTLALQTLLTESGYDAGPADGMLGARTAKALQMFQKDRGLRVTDVLTPAVLLDLAEAAVTPRTAAR
jgi:uncharacterized caspase-like protein/TPR repeat protein